MKLACFESYKVGVVRDGNVIDVSDIAGSSMANVASGDEFI